MVRIFRATKLKNKTVSKNTATAKFAVVEPNSNSVCNSAGCKTETVQCSGKSIKKTSNDQTSPVTPEKVVTMSEIWKYFKHGKTSISCNYCSQTFAFAKDKSTSKLWSHLQSKHTEQFTSTERNRKRKMVEFTSEPKQPAPSTSNKQPPIDELMSPNFAKSKRSELTNDVTEFVTMHNLPFTIAESPFLKRLVMKNYATNWIPSRHDVRAEIPKKAEECVKNLQASVFGQFVSLTLDEYSKGENALFCMTGTWLDETFEFHSRVLSVTSFLSRHTGENICREIDSTLNNLFIEKVVAATRDGARNMAAGCRIARIPSIWCFCHLIHVSIVTSFGKRPEISVLLKKSSDVINFFANSPTGTAAFRRVQGQCSTTFIKATKTRWNSVMQSLNSLLKHQPNLSKYVEQFPTCASVRLINKLAPFDFEQISKIISILEPFDVCTKMASAKSATVSCYQYFINVLTKHLSRFECDLANQINLELEKRTTDVLHIEEIEFSTFLDPRFCNKTFVYSEERWRLIKAKFTHHLIMSSEQKEMEFVSPSYVVGTSSKTPENELWPEDDAGPTETEFEPSQSPLERAIGEQLQKYCNFVKSDKLGFPKPDEEPNQSHSSVFLWWRKSFSHFPDVAREAQRLLPISVSSVASERCFSKASLLFRNTLRSSLEKNLAAGIIQIQTTLAEEMLKKCAEISEESSDEDDEF